MRLSDRQLKRLRFETGLRKARRIADAELDLHQEGGQAAYWKGASDVLYHLSSYTQSQLEHARDIRQEMLSDVCADISRAALKLNTAEVESLTERARLIEGSLHGVNKLLDLTLSC